MVSGFKLRLKLSFPFGSSVALCHLCIGKGKGIRVPLLPRGLVLLVGFFACTIELIAITHVEIAVILAIWPFHTLLQCQMMF